MTVAMAPAGAARQFAEERELLTVPNTWDSPVNCANDDGCPTRESISYIDVEVTAGLDGNNSDPSYNLQVFSDAYLTNGFQVCFFEADHDRIGCRTHRGDWLYHGDLPVDTETVRVVLREGTAAEIELRLYV